MEKSLGQIPVQMEKNRRRGNSWHTEGSFWGISSRKAPFAASIIIICVIYSEDVHDVGKFTLSLKGVGGENCCVRLMEDNYNHLLYDIKNERKLFSLLLTWYRGGPPFSPAFINCKFAFFTMLTFELLSRIM